MYEALQSLSGTYCFFDNLADVDSLISGSSAFSKSTLNIWKFMVHVLFSKPGLENFEHYFARVCDDCNFLETMNSSISKGTAATEIKRLTGADRIIAFGDNLNDIPLFEAADEAYAVSNAHENLKKIATGIIDTNDSDAVVKFISEHSGVRI